MPSAIEAITRSGDHVMRAGTSNATVHGRNAAANNGAAYYRCGFLPKGAQRHGESGTGKQYGDEQREDGQSDVITRPDARIIGEHGDEVRGPDAKARRGRIQSQPNEIGRAQ